MKQRIEVEVEIPDGYEFVRFGIPEKGESIIDVTGKVESAATFAFGRATRGHFIVRKTWQAPTWIKPGWVFPKGDEWYWSAEKPFQSCTDTDWLHCNRRLISTDAFDFVPPPDGMPRQVGATQ